MNVSKDWEDTIEHELLIQPEGPQLLQLYIAKVVIMLFVWEFISSNHYHLELETLCHLLQMVMKLLLGSKENMMVNQEVILADHRLWTPSFIHQQFLTDDTALKS